MPAYSAVPLRERLAVSVTEAAGLLSVGASTVREMLNEGLLERFDTGSHRIIRITMRSIMARIPGDEPVAPAEDPSEWITADDTVGGAR